MKILITVDELNSLPKGVLAPLECEECGRTFYKSRSEIRRGLNGKKAVKYCSKKCFDINKTVEQIVMCSNCNQEFIKKRSQINRTNRNFCSRSCAATYNNTHKTTGNRRSKLEIYLEEQIKLNYPYLECICNGKELINFELDFYFPSLKFAIELNGIFHYEPIYGNDKLEKIQYNDQQKLLLCSHLDIELCVIDSSSCKHLTQKQKDKYWDIINNILQKIVQRDKNYTP